MRGEWARAGAGGMLTLPRTSLACDVSTWLSWAVPLLVPWGGATQQGS